MRLLVGVSEYRPHGTGIANVAWNVVRQLTGMGVDCTVCSPTGPDVVLGSRPMIAKYGRLGLLYFWDRVAAYFGRRSAEYDVAWLHYPLFLRRNPFDRCVVTVHSTARGIEYPPYLAPYRFASTLIETHCLSRLSGQVRLTAVSHQSRADARIILGEQRNVIVIPNGVDVDAFRPADSKSEARARFAIPGDVMVLLSVGRLVHHKMPLRMIDVFDAAEQICGGRLLLIAGAGPMLQPAMSYAAKKGVRNVRFLGYVPDDDLPHLYAAADCFITTAKYEGGEPTLAVAQAMASGLPCIVADAPNSRVVDEARCGLCVDFTDEDNARQRIVSYLGVRHPDDSRNAREYAVTHLDWRLLAQRYLAEFKRALSNER